jgi:hypothetical protein
MRSTPATLAAGATAVLLCTLAAASPAGAATRPAAIGASHPPDHQIVSSGTLSAAPGS